MESSFVNLITLKDFSSDQINDVVDNSLEIKRNPEKYEFALEGKSLAMIF